MNTGDKLGRYELGQKIGAGAMSDVFASRHPLLERDVAIKVLKKEVGSDQQYIARFLDDARAAHGLNHPNIVRVLDVDDSEARPFIVMDLVDGQPLDEWRKGQVDLPVAVKIARDVASALAAAHAGGLIHRDVKPSNVLLERKTKMAKLTDFGAAKREREGGAQLTQMGQRIGTPRYMAPEQVEGGEVSKCTDLFALGALLYELLAGKPAFEGDNVSAVFHGILFKEPTPLAEVRPDVPAPLVELVGRLLAKKPEDRPASAEEVVAALDALDQAAPSGVAKSIPAGAGGATANGQTTGGLGATGAVGTTAAGAAAGTSSTGGASPPGSTRPAEAPTGAPPPQGESKTLGGIMEHPRLVPIAAGVALLLVLLGGGVWLFSGGDEPVEPTVAEDQAEPPAAVPEDQAGEAPPETDVVEAEPPAEAGSEEGATAGGEDGTPADTADVTADEPAATEPPAGQTATTEAEEPAGEDRPAGQPNFATALRQDQAGGQSPGTPGTASDETAPGEAPSEPVGAEAPAAEQPPADQPPTEAAPASPRGDTGGGEAADTAETGPPQQEEEIDTAQVPVAGPPDQPAGQTDAAALDLDCGEGEPGCAFAETVAEAIAPVEGGRPEIFLNKEDGVYLDQEYLVVEVAMPPDLGGYLYLDVYTDNGEVFHLLPEPLRESNDLKQGAMIRVGVEEDERATGIRHWQISGPFGTGYLMAMVTENRLFDTLRPIGEAIEEYRPALLDALDDPTLGRTSYSVVPVEFRPR